MDSQIRCHQLLPISYCYYSFWNDEGPFVAQTHMGSDSPLLINLPLSSLCNLCSSLLPMQTKQCFLLRQFAEGEWLPLAFDLVISCKDVLASVPSPQTPHLTSRPA